MRRAAASAALLVLSGAAPAWAHAALPGIEGLTTSFAHVATEPAQLLLILALALWNGQSADRHAGGWLAAMVLALASGAVAGVVFQPAVLDLMSFALGLAALLGLASGVRLTLPIGLRLAVIAVGGVLAGVFCAPDAGPLPAMLTGAAAALAGSVLAAALVFAIARWCDDPRRPAPFGIGLRVAGSWIAAASLMAAALALRPV